MLITYDLASGSDYTSISIYKRNEYVSTPTYEWIGEIIWQTTE